MKIRQTTLAAALVATFVLASLPVQAEEPTTQAQSIIQTYGRCLTPEEIDLQGRPFIMFIDSFGCIDTTFAAVQPVTLTPDLDQGIGRAGLVQIQLPNAPTFTTASVGINSACDPWGGTASCTVLTEFALIPVEGVDKTVCLGEMTLAVGASASGGYLYEFEDIPALGTC